MANTITVAVTVGIKDASGGVSMAGSDSYTQIGSNYSKQTQIITSAVPVQLIIDPNIADGNLGYLTVRNLALKVTGAAAANQPYINLATDSGMTNLIATIQPGTSHFSQPPGGTITIWAQAHLQDCPATVMAIES